MVWVQIRTDILSVLIWVQTLCKGYQQTTKVAASKERVKSIVTETISNKFSWPKDVLAIETPHDTPALCNTLAHNKSYLLTTIARLLKLNSTS